MQREAVAGTGRGSEEGSLLLLRYTRNGNSSCKGQNFLGGEKRSNVMFLPVPRKSTTPPEKSKGPASPATALGEQRPGSRLVSNYPSPLGEINA